MKVFQDFISKLNSTEKHESNFGYLSMKKGGLFQKERFYFIYAVRHFIPFNCTDRALCCLLATLHGRPCFYQLIFKVMFEA